MEIRALTTNFHWHFGMLEVNLKKGDNVIFTAFGGWLQFTELRSISGLTMVLHRQVRQENRIE